MPDYELPVGFRHLLVEIDFRLCGEETICPHCRKQVHYEIMDTAVTGMHKLGPVLEHVVDLLDDASLAEHYLVVEGHQTLFHI